MSAEPGHALPNAPQQSGSVTIGIVAGEASGDALGAALIQAVRERLPHARFVGVAGPRMQAAGCEPWFPLEKLSVAGFVEVLSRLPQILAMRRELLRKLVAARVHLFIGVDAPDFNLGIEAKLKRAGVRTMHFVSPSIWAWRRERVHKIRRSVHRMLALFPFELPLYEAAGVPVTFVGHPLARDAAATRYAARSARAVEARARRNPSSRCFPEAASPEIDAHSELLLKAAAELHAARPEVALSRSARDARDARPVRSRDLSARRRRASAHASSMGMRPTRCAPRTSRSSLRARRRSKPRWRDARTSSTIA